MIASWPTDIQPVLNVVAESAARLCSGSDGDIRRAEGDGLRSVANYGPLPDRRWILRQPRLGYRPRRDPRRTVHIEDLAAESDDEFPEAKAAVNQFGFGPCWPPRCSAKAARSARLSFSSDGVPPVH